MGRDSIVGVTCHDSRHLAMEAAEAGADYVAFGAFFPTTTKESKTQAEIEIAAMVGRNHGGALRRHRRHHGGELRAADRGGGGLRRGVVRRVGHTRRPCRRREGVQQTVLGMKARKRSAEASVEVDGHRLRWSLEREAQWTTNDGCKGMAFSVRLDGDARHRELLLEFPYPRWKPGARQDKERILPPTDRRGHPPGDGSRLGPAVPRSGLRVPGAGVTRRRRLSTPLAGKRRGMRHGFARDDNCQPGCYHPRALSQFEPRPRAQGGASASMAKIAGNEIRPGTMIEHQGGLWVAVKTQAVKPGKGGAYNQVELKNIVTGTKLNERFRSSETVEEIYLDKKDLPSCSPATTCSPSWTSKPTTRSSCRRISSAIRRNSSPTA